MMQRASSTFAASGADGYEMIMGRWSRQLSGPFLDFADLTDHGNILDAGCGTGSLTAEVLQRTTKARITGVDISEAYIAHVQDTLKSDRAHFEVADLTALSYPDASFDQVYSQLVLLFVPDADKAIRELCRVSMPGGKIAATTWDTGGGFLAHRIFWDVAAMLDPEAEKLRHRAFSRPLTRPDELAQAFSKAGMEDVRSGEISIRTEFVSFDDYWMPFLSGDGPIPAYVRQLPDHLKTELEDALRRAYLGGSDDGVRSFVATAWAVTGLAT